MNFFYPEKDGNGEDLKFSNQFGKYLISHFNTWHGGVHIEGADKAMQAIADGRIIAYRMNKEYQTLKDSSDNTNSETGGEKKYSNNFILIQHDIEISKEEVENEGADDEKTTVKKKFFTFYSLYNHLLPTSAYYKENNTEIRSGIDLPKFMRNETLKATKEEDYDFPVTTIKGLNARTLNSAGVTDFRSKETKKLVIPYGDEVCKVLDEEGKLIKNGRGIKVTYTDRNGDYHDDIYIFDGSSLKDLGDSYKINTKGDSGKFIDYLGFSDEKRIERGSRLREEANGDSAVIGLIPKGTIVNVLEKKEVKIKEGKETYWAKVEGYEGYTHSSNFAITQEIDEERITIDKIVACDIPIKAGELIGYTGLLQGDLGSNYHAAQVDVFMTEEVEEFLSNDFKAGKDKKNYTILPEGTILKKSITTLVDLPKGSTVKVLDIKGEYVNIQEDKQPVKASLNKSYLHNKVDPPGPRNAYFQIKPECFDEINKSHFNNQIPDVNSFVYWLSQNGDITKVEYRPKNNPGKFWVKTKDLFPVEETKTRDKKVTVPIPFGQATDSFLEYLTKSDCREEERIVQEEYYDIHPAKQGEHTTLNKNITKAYLAIPDNEDEIGEYEELCKEAIVDLSQARKVEENKDKAWIQVTCSYVIGNKKETKKGWIENKNFDTFSLHDWKNSGFKTIKAGDEYMYEVKGLRDCNDSHASDFIKKFWKTLNVKNDDVLNVLELDAAYSMLETQLAVSKIVCQHKTEWSYTANEITNEVTKFFDYLIAQEDEDGEWDLESLKEQKLNSIKDQVGKLMFWKEAAGLTYYPPMDLPTPKKIKPKGIKEMGFGTDDPEILAAATRRIENNLGLPNFTPKPTTVATKPVETDATTQTTTTNTETVTEPELSEEKKAPETQEQSQEEKQQEVKPPERTFPSTDQVWHFHPIAFVEHMKKIYGAVSEECPQLVWGNKVSCEFRKRVIQISKRLECDPNHLMTAMALETNKSFRADERRAGSQYVGLIQIGNIAAEEINRRKGTKITPNHLEYMSPEQQLKYVEYYLEPKKGKLKTLADFYLAILWPNAVGHGHEPDYVVFDDNATGDKKKSYWDNKLFLKEKGEITKDPTGKKIYGKKGGKTYVWEIKEEIEALYEEGINHKNRCATNNSCTLLNLELKCPDCNQSHYDVRDLIHFQSQSKGSSNCGTVSRHIIEEINGISCEGISEKGVAYYQLALENKAADTLDFDIKKSKEAIEYLNLALSNNIPIRVGVHHTFKSREHGIINEDTTDHYVVIVGKNCIEGETYYQYWDVGTFRGAQEKYKFKLVEGYKLINDDANAGGGKDGRKYTVTQIARATKTNRVTKIALT
ncbi:SH3 domain-containing protein [Fulvivirga maritima]|uniref:SH3 domain-containing protein n=1 Tax=Fulvivirga maritima TaxID=2904247 RepID=UPI001F23D8B4|nr:SH3 domain-containing protein [Fulvivirga maritima]UII28982.1 SH3 domain-containing protein [Fulvivirga maritima]